MTDINGYSIVGPGKIINIFNFPKLGIYLLFSRTKVQHRLNKDIYNMLRIGVALQFRRRRFACYTEKLETAYQITNETEYSIAK